MATTNCVACGAEVAYEPRFPEKPDMFKPRTCKPCGEKDADKVRQDENARKVADRKCSWKKLCPTIYQETDASRLPKGPTEEVLAWKFGRRGMVLHGPTGRGKTRAAFLLMERLHLEGRSVAVFHGNDFAHQCAEKFGDCRGEEWIASLAKEDVVFFDDLGKFKMTERVEAELFGLIEMRVAWARPIVVTANFSGKSLAEKMTDDRGESFVRRLKEFCDVVEF